MYDFPGNVRELENEIERAATMANKGDLILPEHLSERISAAHDHHTILEDPSLKKRGKLTEMVEDLEKKVIEDALVRHKGNKTKTASELGLSRLGLRKKMVRYEMIDKKFPLSESNLIVPPASESAPHFTSHS
jgi:two-component system response regulator HupR/HoxA